MSSMQRKNGRKYVHTQVYNLLALQSGNCPRSSRAMDSLGFPQLHMASHPACSYGIQQVLVVGFDQPAIEKERGWVVAVLCSVVGQCQLLAGVSQELLSNSYTCPTFNSS